MNILFNGTSGLTLVATIQRLSDGFYYEPGGGTFNSAPLFSAKEITLTEGSSENLGSYTGSATSTSWNDGLYLLRVHNTGSSNVCIGSQIFSIKGGFEVEIGAESTAFDYYYAYCNYQRSLTGSSEMYEIVWFHNGAPVTSGITSPNLEVISPDGTDLINTTPTQIGSTGIYSYVTTNSGEFITSGDSYTIIMNATINGSSRSYRTVLGRDAS